MRCPAVLILMCFIAAPISARSILTQSEFPGANNSLSEYMTNAGAKVKLDLYIEVLCPDCQGFTREQLEPTWRQLKDIMDVDVIPYGNARDHPNPEGGYSFECQNGAAECHGNMLLSCAKKYIADKASYIDFFFCIDANAQDIDAAGPKCALEVGVPYHNIQQCAAGVEGQTLLHQQGVITSRLVPAHTYVPWVVVDGMHTEDIETAATSDLKSYVCEVYKGFPPAPCLPSLGQ